MPSDWSAAIAVGRLGRVNSRRLTPSGRSLWRRRAERRSAEPAQRSQEGVPRIRRRVTDSLSAELAIRTLQRRSLPKVERREAVLALCQSIGYASGQRHPARGKASPRPLPVTPAALAIAIGQRMGYGVFAISGKLRPEWRKLLSCESADRSRIHASIPPIASSATPRSTKAKSWEF